MRIHNAVLATLATGVIALCSACSEADGPGTPVMKQADQADGAAHVWVAARLNDEVWVVDPASHEVVTRIRPGRGTMPAALAASADAVWMIDHDGWVHRIDPASRTLSASVRGLDAPHALAASPDGVWVANGDWWVWRFDPSTNALADKVEIVGGIFDLAFHAGMLWVATDIDGGRLMRVAPGATAISGSIKVEALPAALTAGAAGLWAHDPYRGVLFEISADGPGEPIDLGARNYEGRGLDAAAGFVWVSLGTENAVARVDIASRTVTRIGVGGYVPDVAAGAGAAWAVLPEEEQLVRIDPSTGEIAARIAVRGFPHAVTVR